MSTPVGDVPRYTCVLSIQCIQHVIVQPSKDNDVFLLLNVQLFALVAVAEGMSWWMGLLPLSTEAQPQWISFPSLRGDAWLS